MKLVCQRRYANHDVARRDINYYIVGFNNRVRLQFIFGYLFAPGRAGYAIDTSRVLYKLVLSAPDVAGFKMGTLPSNSAGVRSHDGDFSISSCLKCRV